MSRDPNRIDPVGAGLDNQIARQPVYVPLAAFAPAYASQPVITGAPVAGGTLTVSTGGWVNSPTSYAYQWRRGGGVILGATTSSYALAAADVGYLIDCIVTASNAVGSANERAYAVGPVTASGTAPSPAPANTVPPTISGTAQEGQIITTSTGAWTGSPTGYAYQWLRDGVAVAGATNAARTVATADVGHILSCTVTATNAAGSASVTTAATATVIAAATPVPVNTVAPAISGGTTVGSVLSTTNGTWSNSPTGYAYAWRRDGVDIAGANASTYTLVAADAGHSITSRVFASNAGGAAGATSNAIAAVAASTVTPLTDNTWRVQPQAVSVTGSTADATNQTALLAAKANVAYTTMSQAANTQTIIVWTLGTANGGSGAIVDPGGLLAYTTTTSGGSAANRTTSIDISTDGGTTWTNVPDTQAQTGSPLVNTADQIVVLPACNAVRFTISSTAAHQFRVKLHQLQADPLRNNLFALAGMSVTVQNTQGGQIFDEVQAQYPAHDPVIMVVARSGAKLADMLTEQFQGVIKLRTIIKRVLHDIGPNDFFESGDSLATRGTTVAANKRAAFQAIIDFCNTNNRLLYEVGSGFFDPSDTGAGFPAQYSGFTFSINQSAVVENGSGVPVANQNNGQRAYIHDVYLPLIASSVQVSYDAATKLPVADGYALQVMTWQSYFGVSPREGPVAEGVHPNTFGSSIYRLGVADMYASVVGLTRPHVLKRTIDSFTLTGGVTTPVRNRLYLTLNSLDDNMDAGTRTSWGNAIAGLSAAYVEPAGKTAPTSLPNIVASFDFDDLSTMFIDDAGSVPALDYDPIRLVKSKVGTGTLGNTASWATVPYKQPNYRSAALAGRGALRFDGMNTALTSDSTTGAAINAAGQPFILAWSGAAGVGNASGGQQVAMRNGTTNLLSVAYGAQGASPLRVTGSSLTAMAEGSGPTKGDRCVYLLCYDGTTLTLRRNGAQTASQAWSKPAWTGDNLYAPFLGAGSQAELGLHVIAGAWSTATRDALEQRMMAKAGL